MPQDDGSYRLFGLDLAEQIATEHFAPHNRKADVMALAVSTTTLHCTSSATCGEEMTWPSRTIATYSFQAKSPNHTTTWARPAL